MIIKYLSTVVFLGLSLVLSACGSVNPKAYENLALRTESNIKQAENIDASDYAPLALRSAKMKLQSARDAIARENFDDAQLLLEKALVDAEYASIKSHSEKSQQAAEQIRQNIETLQSQINQS